jgi:hypothetical protein
VPACAAERGEMVAIPQIEAGTDPGAQRRLTEGAPERTFEAVAQHYLAGMERKVLLKKRSPATLRKARWALRDYVFPFVGAKPIDSISSQGFRSVGHVLMHLGKQKEQRDRHDVDPTHHQRERGKTLRDERSGDDCTERGHHEDEKEPQRSPHGLVVGSASASCNALSSCSFFVSLSSPT